MPTDSLSSQERLQLTVRPMVRRDFEQIMRLETLAFSDAWPVKKMRDLTRHPNSHYFVIEHGSKLHRSRRLLGRSRPLLVASLGYMLDGDTATVLSVVIDPEFAGQKVGELLVWAAIQEVEHRGVARIKAQVRASNEGAHRLYDRYGFRVVGRLPSFYDSPDEDALDMEVSIAGREHRPGVEHFSEVIPKRFEVTDLVTPRA